MRFHHIGIACRDISVALDSVRRLHDIVAQSDVVLDEQQNANLCLVTTRDGFALELISGPQVEGLLKRGVSYYHVCYAVDGIDSAIDRLTEAGAVLCSPPKPSVLFEN